MKKEVIISILTLLLFACQQPEKQDDKVIVQKNEQTNKANTWDNQANPINDFKMLVTEGNIESAKNIISKYGLNYKDEYGRNFFSSSVRVNLSIIEYLLESGYIMNSTDRSELFQATKSDTSLLSSLYLKYNRNKSEISSAVFHNCNAELIKYYLKTENPDLSKCSYNLPNTLDFHCLCILNHCENNSVELLDIALKAYPNSFPDDNSCIVENWLQDYPKLADSLLVERLIMHQLIPETTEWSPLISYCKWNKNDIVKMLLKNGYSPNWNNSSNLLYLAITRVGDGFGEHLTKEIRNETVELLLAHGANPELQITIDYGENNEKMNFVEFANSRYSEDNTELFQILNQYAR